ncbi:unnamed protein product [Clavelina lepadiformis]|uniref:Phospholipid scramblase n=1 Tax=Clavelina lepadiformis TaxID=159417 RepID=A0ABP0F0N1_CLALP
MKEPPNWVDTHYSGEFLNLEPLTGVNEVWIKQQPADVVEVRTEGTITNQHLLLNKEGQKMFVAHEEVDSQAKVFNKARGYVMHLYDRCEQEVIRLTRPYKFCTGFCWCAAINHCSIHIDVEAPVGQLIGTVKQGVSCWSPEFDVVDADERKLFHIPIPIGPAAAIHIWKVNEHSASSVGIITRDMRDPKVVVTFPSDLNVKYKALLLGAAFLIMNLVFVDEGPQWTYQQ